MPQALGIKPSTCFSLRKTLAYGRPLVFRPAFRRQGRGLRLEAIATRFDVARFWRDAGSNRFVLVDKAESNGAIRAQLTIGQRFAILIGAFGLRVAAWSEIRKAELRKRAAELRWQKAPDAESCWRGAAACEIGTAIEGGRARAQR